MESLYISFCIAFLIGLSVGYDFLIYIAFFFICKLHRDIKWVEALKWA